MVLISVQSVETNNGYQFKNDFSETIEIDPKASISVVNALFERENKFVVTTANNFFDIALGTNTPTQIVIAEGTYTGVGLAEAIQYALFLNYGALGIYFNVNYIPGGGGANSFNIDYSYEPQKLEVLQPQNYTQIGTSSTIGDDYSVNFSGVVSNNKNYVLTKGPIETTVVPSTELGGSFIEGTISAIGGQLQPPVAANTNWLFGLTSLPTVNPAGPVAGAGELTTLWLGVGMVFFKRAVGTSAVRFIEAGNQTATGGIAWEVKDGDTYKIVLAPDGDNGSSSPEYWYRRKGGRYRQFNVGSQITKSYWGHLALQGVFGADHTDTDTNGPVWKDIKYTPSVSNMVPEKFDTFQLIKHTLTSNNLQRDPLGVAYVSDEVGAMSKVIPANVSSKISFNLSSTDLTHNTFLISIIDENQRDINSKQAGTRELGNPYFGNTTDRLGNVITAGMTNPAIASFEFDRENNTIHRRETNMDFSNPTNSIKNKIVRPNIQKLPLNKALPHGFTDTSLFTIIILAESEEILVYCNHLGTSDPNDDVIIYTGPLLQTVPSGVKTVTATNAGSGWTPGTDYWFYLTDPTNGAVVQMTGQANGTLAAPILIKSGKGYALNASYTSFPINIQNGATQVFNNVVTPVFRVDALWDADIPTANNYGTSWKNTGSNGYRWILTVPDWIGTNSTKQAGATLLNYSLQAFADNAAPIVKFLPRVLPAFGDLIGFSKSIYVFDEGTAPQKSDSAINAQSSKDDNISINVDNLPIKSYIGKGYLASSTLNTNPLGSQQGVTRTVAVLPRSHEDNGNAGTGTMGPYYYDYFPYSIPLHNAVELNVNELEITLKNRDGTLATDITKTSLVLNISKVDNMGEGSMGGSIGNPIQAGRGYDRLDINKTLRVGNMAPSGSATNGALRHERADFSNSAISSGKDKTNAL